MRTPPLMDLRGRPANDGAWRLAWAIGKAGDPRAAWAALEAEIGVNRIERLLDGSLVPGDLMAAAIWAWSRGTIDKRDFQRICLARWHDAPPRRAQAMAPFLAPARRAA